jgi:hypothetical protein
MYLPPGLPTQQQPMWPVPEYGPPPIPAPRRRWRLWLALSVAVVVVLVAVGGGAALWYTGHGAISAAPPASSTPTPSAINSSAITTTPADIFAGTPVGTYANGADGIVVPAAAATRNFSRASVATDLAIVKQVIVATRLDPKVLTGHDPSTFIGMLAPDLRSSIQKEIDNLRTVPYLTEIGTSGALTQDPIKVSGTMTYVQKTDNQGIRMLVVSENYVFVYPFSSLMAGIPTKPGDHLAVLHEDRVWSFAYASDVASGSRGLWIESGITNAYNIDCSQYHVGLIVVGSDQPDMTEAFDPTAPVDDLHGNC